VQVDQIDTGRIAHELAAARPALDAPQQRLALALYRLLAEGAPVTREQLARHADVAAAEVGQLLDDQPGVYFDEAGRVVGFWGLGLDGMPHRLTVAGRELGAWCAWDTLFLPELLDATARVASTCPTTCEPVTLTATPDGARDISPSGAALSFVRRETPFDADMIRSFCHLVHFFVSADAAGQWTATHPRTFVLAIEQGVAIAHEANRATFGTALAGGCA
jgi:alkylmercury lyase